MQAPGWGNQRGRHVQGVYLYNIYFINLLDSQSIINHVPTTVHAIRVPARSPACLCLSCLP